MYKLTRSTLDPTLWRDQDVSNIYPDLMKPGMLTDVAAKRLVACAKKRFDGARGLGGNTDYSQLEIVLGSDLKGLCFVAADEFERYFQAQKIDAKAVMVEGEGSNHYFTVVNLGKKDNALIVDATWRQFHAGGNALRYCLVGTLNNLTAALGDTECGNLLEMYKAGLTALKSWKSYSCFG